LAWRLLIQSDRTGVEKAAFHPMDVRISAVGISKKCRTGPMEIGDNGGDSAKNEPYVSLLLAACQTPNCVESDYPVPVRRLI
jgi:hypothetical protein